VAGRLCQVCLPNAERRPGTNKGRFSGGEITGGRTPEAPPGLAWQMRFRNLSFEGEPENQPRRESAELGRRFGLTFAQPFHHIGLKAPTLDRYMANHAGDI